jgi:hypothetical protein
VSEEKTALATPPLSKPDLQFSKVPCPNKKRPRRRKCLLAR